MAEVSITTGSFRRAVVVVAKDFVCRAIVDHRKTRHPVLDSPDFGADPWPAALRLPFQSVAQRIPDGIGDRFPGGRCKRAGQTVGLRILDTYCHWWPYRKRSRSIEQRVSGASGGNGQQQMMRIALRHPLAELGDPVPVASSRLIYGGVPSDIPASVIRLPAVLAARAMPTSATSALPSCSYGQERP